MSALRLRRTAVLLAIIGLVLTGCGTDRSDTDEGADATDLPLLVTTVAPLTSIVANVAGEEFEVVGLVPEGVNSHTFEPPPSAAEVLARADAIFVNGLGLEEHTEDLARANLGPDAVLVELGDATLPESEWIYDFSFPESGGKPNPHLWTNPPMVREYAAVVRDTLVDLDPSNRATYEANFTRFAGRVDALDAAMTDATATIPAERRTLLTYHDAYAYFAEHYGWTVIGAIQPSDFDEPSPREVADLIVQIREQEVPVVFGSEVFPSPVLEQIGRESGATYIDDLRDDDLPGDPGDPEHSWLGLMQLNYVTMVEAFGGDAGPLDGLHVADPTTGQVTYPQ